LKHRLIAGSLLAAAMGGVLYADGFLAPYFPCLLSCAVLVGVLTTRELAALLPPETRPQLVPTTVGVLAVLLSNWAHLLLPVEATWTPVVTTFAAAVIGAFLHEMARYREPFGAVTRLALTVFAVAYLGLLPSFFLKLRWLPEWSGLALTLTIFVPKVGDIGAYFVGRYLGKRQFAPRLSPKKTWEGFAGGLAASVATAVGLSFAGPVFRYGIAEAVGFGLAVGLAGVLGDLAESLVKRDCQTKDAAKSIPGFGGLLDVIDSILFAGPVAYWWLTR
jgi:phosphatidate cytidylyltransferase